jgi:tetratricopeptide (TPR) repeat protein
MSWEETLQDVEERKRKGESLLSAGAYEEAKQALEGAKEALEKFYASFNDSLVASLTEARTRIVEKNLALGDTHKAEGNHELANERYKIALDLASDRDRDEVLIRLGQLEQREAPSENLERLGQKVADNPDSAEAIYDFATELAMEGYLPEAIRYFEKLAQMTPDDADVFYRLGNAYLDTKRLPEAETAYSKALELSFEDPAEIHYRLGWVEMEGRASTTEARKRFLKALEIRPDHLECLKELAHLAQVDENYEEAIDYLKTALKYDSEDAQVCSELGDLYEAQGKLTEAQQYWTKTIELEPDGDAAEYAREKLAEAGFEESQGRDSNV